MRIWAAIDILNGRVVTLRQGDINKTMVWSDDPLGQAKKWEREGASGIHVVDINSVFNIGSNKELIIQVIRSVSIPVQVGGGLRNKEAVSEFIDKGASRVIVGTAVIHDKSLLELLLRNHGSDKIVVASDYSGKYVVSRGWSENTGVTLEDYIKRIEKEGVKNAVLTNVARDGTSLGPDLETLSRVRKITSINLIASGGIRNKQDIFALEKIGIREAIVGRALYGGGLNLKECS